MGIWEGAGSATIGGATGLIGMIGQNQRADKAQERQKELMDIQNKNQKGLNQQGHDLQLDMWNKTNAKAQMEHYKEAGLNPGLMYGGSGAGGATTGSQGGGSAASGNAAAPMDIGNITQMMKAFGEIALNLSKENKSNAETEEQKFNNWINKYTKDEAYLARYNTLKGEAAKGEQDEFEWHMDKMANFIDKDGNVSKDTPAYKEAIEKRGKAKLENELDKAKINLNKEQTDKIWHEIRQKWVELGFKGIDSLVGNWIKALKGRN